MVQLLRDYTDMVTWNGARDLNISELSRTVTFRKLWIYNLSMIAENCSDKYTVVYLLESHF